MRNQQPDNFFREKLANYHKPAPAGAWNRIESSLQKPASKFGWWKIAASLLLLATIGYIFWSHHYDSTTQPISKAQPEIESSTQNADRTKIDSSEKLQDTKQTESSASSTTAASTDKKEAPKQIRKYKTTKATIALKEKSSGEEILPAAEVQRPGTTRESTASNAPAEKNSSSRTLVITAEESNKYLDKDALAEATTQEKKSSTFKKLLKKADEFTSNQDPFGDLRVKKNEILALDFKNDKRGQNK